jgi:hypothetical protein
MPRNNRSTIAALPLWAAAAIAPTAHAQSFETFPRGAIGGLSEDGRFVAYRTGESDAFRFDAETGDILPLGVGQPQDITPDGSAVVGTLTRSGGAFHWSESGGYTNLNAAVPAFADERTRAYAISDDGRAIVGAPIHDPSFVYRLDGPTPTIHLPEGARALQISGDGSTVPGWFYPPGGDGYEAAVYDATDGSARVLLAGCDCGFTVASRDGSVLAGYSDPEVRIIRVVDRGAGYGEVEFIDLFPGAFRMFFFDMSADGSVFTGTAMRPDGAFGWIWTEDRGLRTIHDYLTVEHGFDLDGWALEMAMVSPDGRAFAGLARTPTGEYTSYLARLGPACVADVDGDGALTIFDFLAYQNRFDAGDPTADLDGDGLLTIFDFLAFQNAFDIGCE